VFVQWGCPMSRVVETWGVFLAKREASPGLGRWRTGVLIALSAYSTFTNQHRLPSPRNDYPRNASASLLASNEGRVCRIAPRTQNCPSAQAQQIVKIPAQKRASSAERMRQQAMRNPFGVTPFTK